MNETFKFISSQQELDEILPIIRGASSLAVDVEFDNKYSYDLIICLVQISTGKRHFVIDPFEVNLQPLKTVFENPDVIKLLFAGIQDIQLLHTVYNWQIQSVIDLSTIYQMIKNDDNQTSLNDVIQDVLGVNIPKDKQLQSKEDWKQRPLPYKMQLYAARDVIYLHRCLIAMQKEITTEQQNLLEVYFLQLPLVVDQTDNSLMYAFHLCTSYNLKSRTDRFLMYSLVKFREHTAEVTETSSGYVLSKSHLKTLVQRKPRSIKDLKDADIYHQGVKKYAHEILELIRPIVHHNTLPDEEFYQLEQTYKIYYPHYKYLDRQYNWLYDVNISTYRNRRGMLKILKKMLEDRVDTDLNYIYTKYLNHQIAIHEEINLFELRRAIEDTESKEEIISVIYTLTNQIYDIKAGK